MTCNQCTISRAFLFLAAFLAVPSVSRAVDHPSYSLEETIVEYDVDPTWPKRPCLGN